MKEICMNKSVTEDLSSSRTPYGYLFGQKGLSMVRKWPWMKGKLGEGCPARSYMLANLSPSRLLNDLTSLRPNPFSPPPLHPGFRIGCGGLMKV